MSEVSPETTALMTAIADWQEALRGMGTVAQAFALADTPAAQDEARTLAWQACDVLDAATEELAKATRAATDRQRRQIRVDRMAGVTVTTREEVPS